MGGFGSGRPSGTGHVTVEASRSIDVNRLHREGCLHPGWVGSWQWTRDGEKVASISLRAEADRLHLSYRMRIDGGDCEDVVETVRIVRALPLRRLSTLFHLPWHREWYRLRSPADEALRSWDPLPLPALLSTRLYLAARGLL